MMLEIFGEIKPPPGIEKWQQSVGGDIAAGGMIPFLNTLVRLLIVMAGLYALLNLILAGYGFISAGGDPKAVEKAWAKIWQSLVGLTIIAASFLLVAIFGWILFGDPSAILSPKVYGPLK